MDLNKLGYVLSGVCTNFAGKGRGLILLSTELCTFLSAFCMCGHGKWEVSADILCPKNHRASGS